MAASTDSDYNALSREVSCKIDMYIFGTQQPPLTITKDNYLVDFDLLDEGSADGTGPFGSVTSNELSFTLHNAEGMFSPTNASSPYYGYMKKGVECRAYLRVGTKDWDKVGTFYISDWSATITGITANIVANDKLYSALGRADLALPVMLNQTYATFYEHIFDALDIDASIDATLTGQMYMAYSAGSNSALLTDLSTGAMALCYCDHNGMPTVQALISPKSVRATLTDADQIISVDATYSISAGYSGANVTYHLTQESAALEVLHVEAYNVGSGRQASTLMNLSITPLVRLLYASLVGDTDAYISELAATSTGITVTTQNTGSPVTVPLSVYGTSVDTASTTIGDTVGDNILEVDNKYIQSTEAANSVLTVLQRYVHSQLPKVTLRVRGNPLLNIGDKLVVASEGYNLEYTGILIRQHFTYNGALTSELTLIDAALLEDS